MSIDVLCLCLSLIFSIIIINKYGSKFFEQILKERKIKIIRRNIVLKRDKENFLKQQQVLVQHYQSILLKQKNWEIEAKVKVDIYKKELDRSYLLQMDGLKKHYIFQKKAAQKHYFEQLTDYFFKSFNKSVANNSKDFELDSFLEKSL